MLKAKTITIVGLALTALSVIAPIAWDIWANPYQLSLLVHGRTLLIQRSEGIDGLRVTLAGREIEKLFSTEISIENTGRKLIARDDVIKPLTITFVEAPILGVALKERFPTNLEYVVQSIPPSQIQVNFDLLNRGEKVTLNILTDKLPKRIDGIIRAKNLSELYIRDYQTAPPLMERIPMHVFYITGLSLFLLVFGVNAARKEFGPLRRDAFFISETLKPGFEKNELNDFLQKNIWHRLTDRQKTRLEEKIQNADPADEKSTHDLAYAITYEALNQDASGIVAIAAVLAIVGLVYGCARIVIAVFL